MVRATGLNHVGLSTADLDAALAFYRDGLGFVEFSRFSWETGNQAADAGLGVVGTAADVVLLHAGNVYLEVLRFRSPATRRIDSPPSLRREGITHIALEVTDLDEAVALCLEVGGRLARPETASPSRVVRDAEGNLIELRRTPDSDAAAYTALAVHVPATAGEEPAPRDQPDRSLIRGLHHAAVCTRDADAAAAFYARAGIEIVSEATWAAEPTSPEFDAAGSPTSGRAVMLGLGNAYIELLEFGAAMLPRPTDARIIDLGFNHLCVDVLDIGRLHEHLLRGGMEAYAPWVTMPGGQAAMGYALSPDGVPLELLEHRRSTAALWPGHLHI